MVNPGYVNGNYILIYLDNVIVLVQIKDYQVRQFKYL